MSRELFKEYIEIVLSKRPGAIFNHKCLLTVDSATSHDESVIQNSNIIMVKVCVQP